MTPHDRDNIRDRLTLAVVLFGVVALLLVGIAREWCP